MNPFRGFTKFEWILWFSSLGAVTLAFMIGRAGELLTLIASLLGVTALIFIAKGRVLGQILTVAFSLLYAAVSLRLRYFGEMITYLGMTAPIAAITAVSWLRHPYEAGKSEVKIERLGKKQARWMFPLAALVTLLFYFILRYFHTASLAVSTISITTSFLAAYLMLCRSTYYALAYGANDVVLIVLWVMATLKNPAYLPMAVCFLVFLCNDLYGFLNWQRMSRRQKKAAS